VLKALGSDDFMLLENLLPKRARKLVEVAEAILIGNHAERVKEKEENADVGETTDLRQEDQASETSLPRHTTG
jgi:hypothetical protein